MTFPIQPFDDYPEADYAELMDFILRVESVQAVWLGNWLAENLKPRKVIDMGCGPGIYLVPFFGAANAERLHGVDACAVGGQCLPRDDYERWDLRFPYHPSIHFDLALCLETAEHLPPESSDTLLDSLARCADTILFSAATPGQGGLHHSNEQPTEYWLTKFLKRGYEYHPIHFPMREFLATLPDHCSRWLKENSFLLAGVK
jgi:hypothetical protein